MQYDPVTVIIAGIVYIFVIGMFLDRLDEIVKAIRDVAEAIREKAGNNSTLKKEDSK